MRGGTHLFCAICMLVGVAVAIATPPVRINELSAERSTLLVYRPVNKPPRLGAGVPWFEPGFDDAPWHVGVAPLGFGYAGVGTDIKQQMRDQAFSFYARCAFEATPEQAGRSDSLLLTIDYDDGFVAYLNGREILRKNLGAAGGFVYYDQPAFNVHHLGLPATALVARASDWLVAGTNILAIQVHNSGITDPDAAMRAELVMPGSPPATLVATNAPWRYQVGYYEPSGGLIDASVVAADSAMHVAWGTVDFDDAAWPTGPGGFGFGDGDDATDLEDEMLPNGVVSVYVRQAFVVSGDTAARPDAVTLSIDYDDGFVAYVNGREVARRNLRWPGQYILHDREADGAREAGVAEAIDIGGAWELLREGTNVLAIQAHNHAFDSSDLSMIADLGITSGVPVSLVVHTNLWHYHVGTNEPVEPPPLLDLSADTDFPDWVELVNTGAVPVDLTGWCLSDNDDETNTWSFPSVTLDGGQYLVVCCSGRDIRSPHAPYLHTNFKLDKKGEFLALYDATGGVVSAFAPEFPKQSLFHSYGWDEAARAYRYFETPTPGRANAGTTFDGLVARPTLEPDGGFYDGPVTAVASCATPGAVLRYTTDGSEPTAVTGALYTGPILVSTSTAVRVRAFLDGRIPSAIATRTYLLDQPPAVRSLPAISLVADYAWSIHKPHGVTAIVGGIYSNDEWRAVSPDDYNMLLERGHDYERPASVEFLNMTNERPAQVDCGIRSAGSNYSRPRYSLQDLSGLWDSHPYTNKPQINLFFRDCYGAAPLDFDWFSVSSIDTYESMRLRSGKNDYDNPFLIDELMRRTFHDMGQAAAVGTMANVFVNGEYKCYYNPCQRYDEHFMRESFGSDADWDIISRAKAGEGDEVAWDELFDFLRTHDPSNATDYAEVEQRLNIENYIDYIILNAYAGTSDWPNNNWYAARERTPEGRFRYFVWDAEGGLGRSARDPETYNTFTNDLATRDANIPELYRALQPNPEFRVLFADRVQKHLFGGGALTETNLLERFGVLRAQLEPIMQYYRGEPVYAVRTLNWINRRRTPFFSQLRGEGLWNDVPVPIFVHPGGTVPSGFTVELTTSRPTATIFYTLDGTDPRARGGAAVGTAYTGPFRIDGSRTVRARLRDGAAWSPLVEAGYRVPEPSLVMTEIMYNPRGGQDDEFLELRNVSTTAIDLATMRLTDGVTFDFSAGRVLTLPAGAYVLVVKNLEAFASRYPTNGLLIAGAYDGNLSNGGETLTLEQLLVGVLQTVAYGDGWYPQTDGEGFSLTAIDQTGRADDWSDRAAWRASVDPDGSPGTDDDGRLPDPGDILINEILAHTDASPVGDWIELRNTTATPIDVGGWYLSDSATPLTKYAFPAGTTIAAGGYAVFDASNHFAAVGQAQPFAFSEFGDEAYLSSPTNTAGELTGYRTSVRFGASEREVTFGTYPLSDGSSDFTALTHPTPGAANAPARVGPLVLSEIMYDPASGGNEFLELYNISNDSVPLYDPENPTNTWRLDGAITYTFPTQCVVNPFSGLLVVDTNPAAFKARYSLPESLAVYGPYSGRLDNAGEDVRLTRPGDPDIGLVPYILVEHVDYNDKAPWPVGAAGGGLSIERLRRAAYGNDPANWRCSSVSGGTPRPTPRVDSDGDGLPDVWEGDTGLSATNAADGNLDADGDGRDAYGEYVAGTSPRDGDDAVAVRIVQRNGHAVATFRARATDGAAYEGLVREYSLERSAALAPPAWQEAAPVGYVTDAHAEVTGVHTNLSVPPAFYRLRVWLRDR